MYSTYILIRLGPTMASKVAKRRSINELRIDKYKARDTWQEKQSGPDKYLEQLPSMRETYPVVVACEDKEKVFGAVWKESAPAHLKSGASVRDVTGLRVASQSDTWVHLP